MKNINIFFTVILGLLITQISLSQQLLKVYNPNTDLCNQIVSKSSDLDSDFIKEKILFFEVNSPFVDYVLNHDTEKLDIQLPFFNDETLNLTLSPFSVYSETLELTRHTPNGIITENYSPSIKTYRVDMDNDYLKGVFIFSNSGLKAILNINNEIYQMRSFKSSIQTIDNLHLLSNIKDGQTDFDFICGYDDSNEIIEEINHSNNRIGNAFGCAEIVIELDYYTVQTFDTYQESVDWALEMMAVVNGLYLDEINVGIKSYSAQIWETVDPYSSFIEEPQNMLISLRENWTNSEVLGEINRHLVHLFSKRDNTGTGGIAFLNGIGSFFNGYGFSSNLMDVEEYIDLVEPYFFWNIYCLAHELGHNFGAKHTQWCGWPGGPIDNCTNIGEIIPGECSDYNNNPSAQIGTIMSYCHTWSFEDGGGIVMKFHDYVKDAIIAYTGFQTLDDCENNTILGCIDENACNYDIEANTNDDSCIYAESGFDCFGNCLNDEDGDGVCDNTDLSFNEIEQNELFLLYPNPANHVINVKMRDASNQLVSLNLFNSLGQLVLSESNLNQSQNFQIDISSIAQGFYSAYLITDSQIEKENLIIQ